MLDSFIEHRYTEPSHVQNREGVVYLLLGHDTAGKEVQLDHLLVRLHEISHQSRLVDDFPELTWIHLTAFLNVYWSAYLVNAHIPLLIMLIHCCSLLL